MFIIPFDSLFGEKWLISDIMHSYYAFHYPTTENEPRV